MQNIFRIFGNDFKGSVIFIQDTFNLVGFPDRERVSIQFQSASDVHRTCKITGLNRKKNTATARPGRISQDAGYSIRPANIFLCQIILGQKRGIRSRETGPRLNRFGRIDERGDTGTGSIRMNLNLFRLFGQTAGETERKE